MSKTQKSQLITKKTKRHKSTLCDWRELYDERDNISEKQEMRKTSFDKMQITDRLFYPSNKRVTSHFGNQDGNSSKIYR